MPKTSTTNILPIFKPEPIELKSLNYNWRTWAKASLVFATTTGAFLALKATGSFSLISSWLKSSLLETDSNESSALMNPNDSSAQVYTTSISEDMSTSLKGGIDSIQLANFEELHLADSVTTDVKSTWLGTWSDNAVTKYIRTLGEESWQCQAGLTLGTAGALVTGNPLPLGIGALSCLWGADAADPIVVNPIPDQTALIGKNLEFIIPANTFNDMDGDVLNYNVTLADGNLLPGWLTVNSEPKLLGSLDTDGVTEMVEVVDSLAYVADGAAGLKIIDVSNATAPVLKGSLGAYTTLGVTVIENLAYMANGGAGFRIIDISTPSNLTEIGSLGTSYAMRVVVKDNHAYVADHSEGLKIIDVSNPYAPVLVGSLGTASAFLDVVVKNNYAYVADSTAGLKIIDVSNATYPTLAGNIDTYGAWEVAVNGNLAYVADDYEGLKIIDVSNPSALSLAGSLATHCARGVKMIGNYAYVADANLGAGAGLKIIDVSNTTYPTLAGSIDTYSANGVAVNGNFAYVADAQEGLKIISVQMPKLYGIPQEEDSGIINIKIVADDGKGGWISDIFTLDVQHAPVLANPISDQTVNVGEMFNFTVPVTAFNDADRDMLSYNIKLADGSPLPEWLKVETISRPSLLNSYNTPGSAYGVAVVNDIAYVADDTGGLRILNVKDPATPSLLGQCGLGCSLTFARGLAVSGNTSYVVDNNSLRIINVGDPANPSYLGSYATICKGVAVSGNIAYVAGGSSGLQIVDVSDPTDPGYLGSYNTPGTAMGVAVLDEIAYVADESGGLQIINVNNSTNPVFLSNYTTPLSALGVAVADNIAYVADNGSVQIIDVSNPSDPKFLSSYATAGVPSGISVSNHAVYVAYIDGTKGGLQIINVNNSTDPKLLGTYSLPATARGVTVLGDVAYVADDTSGLQIVNVPQVPKLTGIPQEKDKGTLNVRVTVDDGRGGQIWDAYSLYVQHAPVVVNPLLDQTTLIGRNFEWIVPANTFNDTDGNALSYTVTRIDGSPLPAWLKVENPIQPTLLGSLGTGGSSVGLAVSGNYAYVAQYGKLLAVDIRSSSAPILVGSLDISKAMYVAVNNNFAYVVDETVGLKIIDISNPANLTLAGSFPSTVSGPYGVDVIGNLVYLADLSAGLKIIDASNPAAPILKGSIDTSYAYKVAVKDNLAYLADHAEGLKIIDVSNATDPILLGSFDTFDAWGVTVNSNLVYVADSLEGLKIIDVSNSSSPSLIGSIATYTALGVKVNDNYAYVADAQEGLKIIDVSNPTNLTLAGSFDTDGSANGGMSVIGNLAYIADGSAGLKIINVVEMPKLSGIPQESDAGILDIKVTADDGKGNQVSDVFDLNVRPILIVDNPIPNQTVFVDQDFGYIIPVNTFNDADGNAVSYNITLADGNLLPEWLRVGSLTEQPTLLGSLDTDHACEVTVNGNYSYVADASAGLKIIDVSNTSAPILKGTFGSSNAREVVIKDNYAYLADYAGGLKIINISNVTDPTLAGSIATYNAMGVKVNGSLAYVADHEEGLKIINISNPTNLTLAGSIATNCAMKVEVNGNLAYVADAQDGIKIIDVSNITNPTLLGSLDTYGAYEVTVTGGLAYVADSQEGLKIIDVSNSSAPTLLSSVDANVYGVAVKGNYVYVADINDGLKIIDISNASAPILIGEFNTTAAEGVELNGDLVYVADGDDGLKIIIPPILSGIPQEENLGTINIKITADDSKGNRASDIFTLEVKSGISSSSSLPKPESSSLSSSSLPKPKSSSFPSSSSPSSNPESSGSTSESIGHTSSSEGKTISSSSTLSSESMLSSKSKVISSSTPTSQSIAQSKTSKSSFTSESKGGFPESSVSKSDHSPGITATSLLATILASIGGVASVMTGIVGAWFKYRKYKIASVMYQQNPFAAEIRKHANINVSDFESNEGQKYIKIVDNLASKLEEQGIDVKEMDQEELRTVTLHSVKVIKDKVKPQKSWLWHKRIPVDALEKAKKSITNKVIRKYVKGTNQEGITLQISKGSGIIDSGELSKFKEIGQGAMGIVYKARYHGSDVAIKQLPIIAADSNELKQFEQEAELMKELRHPHVVNFYGYYQDPTHYSIVMEYVSGGSLDKVLYDTQQAFPWYPTRWDIAHDVASAVSFLHSNHIIHRDLKSQNVLVYRQDDRMRAKVADVGIAKILKEEEMATMTKGMGTPLWMAPEVIEAQGEKKKITYDEKVDVYSYGIILSELINRKAPFSEIDNFFKVIPQVLEGNRPAFDKESAPSNFVALMERCWAQRAAERPEIKEVVDTLDQMEQEVQAFEC